MPFRLCKNLSVCRPLFLFSVRRRAGIENLMEIESYTTLFHTKNTIQSGTVRRLFSRLVSSLAWKSPNSDAWPTQCILTRVATESLDREKQHMENKHVSQILLFLAKNDSKSSVPPDLLYLIFNYFFFLLFRSCESFSRTKKKNPKQ